MRKSVIAGLVVLGIVGIGLGTRRCTIHTPYARADVAVPRPPQRTPAAPRPPRRAPEPVRGPAEPAYKEEVLGPPQSKSNAARTEALKVAAERVAEFMQQKYPAFRYIPTPQFLTDRRMVNEGKDELQTLADADAPVMIRHRVTVEVLPEHVGHLMQEDRKIRVADRLWQAGRGIAGLLVVLVAFAGYVRLDEWTKGYLSLPLKLGAAALAVAGPLVFWWLI